MTQEEIDRMEKKALEQFTTGKSLFGKDGAFAPLLRNFLDKALEAEMEAHLGEAERSKGTKRNGKQKKTLRSGVGTIELSTPQDRHSSCEPELVRERETRLEDTLAEKVPER